MSHHVTDITQLYARYSFSIDGADLESLRGCFTADGGIEIIGGPSFAGAEGLARLVDGRRGGLPRPAGPHRGRVAVRAPPDHLHLAGLTRTSGALPRDGAGTAATSTSPTCRASLFYFFIVWSNVW